MAFFETRNSLVTDFLFEGWKVDTQELYIGTLVACIALTVIVEVIHHTIRPKVLKRLHDEEKMDWSYEVLEVLLFGTEFTISYLLMLAVMAYNGGVLVAIVLGSFFGYLLFAPVRGLKKKTTSKSDSSDGVQINFTKLTML
eukprot:m.53549 g.53549  ORF g.53549 m.53549 type:complete len:141 (+) comp21776_c0_seq2:209-631(+)